VSGVGGARERVLQALLFVYKRAVSPLLHGIVGAKGACRFQPTCSEYATIAFAEYGAVRGGAMAIARLLRCHPFHRGGYDPVPAKAERGILSGRTGKMRAG
jgi:hypothetical protein